MPPLIVRQQPQGTAVKTTFKSFVLTTMPLMASLVLTACGGGTTGAVAPKDAPSIAVTAVGGENLPSGISAAAMESGYGQPKSQAEIEAMAKQLSGYFNGSHGNDPESLMGAAKSMAVPKSAPLPQVVYRFLNTLNGVHFYTISTQERDRIVATLPIYNLEGAAFFALQAPASGLSPVYRFYNKVSGTHFYTISEAEKDDVVARLSSTFTLEGVAWYAGTSAGDGWNPIHRFFNTQTGRHFYTASETERASVLANLKQFTYEGIAYYIRDAGDPFLSGTVAVNGMVRNAVVCLDTNANNDCDAGEPVSPKTGADGIYRITVRRSAVSEAVQNASSLIAKMVPGAWNNPNTTMDQGDGENVSDNGFVLKQAPGKTGQINPLSTLVASGIASGLVEAQSRQYAALQLAIAETKIDNYQDDPAKDNAAPLDNARWMAAVVASALDDGVPLVVGRQNDAVVAAPGDLRSLRFTDTNNFNYLQTVILAKPAGTAGGRAADLRDGKVDGVTQGFNSLYNQAYLTPAGWTVCDPYVIIPYTLGVPNRSTFCEASTSVGYRNKTSIAGQSMVAFVTGLQGSSLNTINVDLPTIGLLGALGTATFPAGSNSRTGPSLNLNQPVFINSVNTDGRASGASATLENYMLDHPASSADLSLPNYGASVNLGLGSASLKNLRVAFKSVTNATSGTVQFYECDLDAPTQSIVTNCAKTQTGTYAINTINGDRVMSFAGHAPTVSNQERLYAEVSASNQLNVTSGGNELFMARRQKPGTDNNVSENTRLDATAWGAMKAQLGI